MQSQNILGPRRTIATLADIEAIEREMPWAQRLAHDSAYALIAEVAQRKPDHAAIVFLPNGAPEETPITITYSDLVRQMTRTANLLHDLALGRNDSVSILLPNLPQMHYLLWGGAATCVSNPSIRCCARRKSPRSSRRQGRVCW